MTGGMLLVVVGVAVTVSQLRAESVRDLEFHAWLDGAETFIRTASLSTTDVANYQRLRHYASRIDNSARPRRGPSAAAMLDSLMHQIFAKSAPETTKPPSSRGRRMREAYALAADLRVAVGGDSIEYLADSSARRAWLLITLLRARLGLEALKDCDPECPVLQDVSRDFEALVLDRRLRTDGINGRGRIHAYLVSAVLSDNAAPDSLVTACAAAFSRCFQVARQSYLPSDTAECSVGLLRARNNQLDLFSRVAAKQKVLAGGKVSTAGLPIWILRAGELADTLDRRSAELLSCLPKGSFLPPLVMTVAEAAATRFELLPAAKKASNDELRHLGELLRLAMAVEISPDERFRVSALCGLRTGPMAERVWQYVITANPTLPNADIRPLRQRIANECR